MKCRAEKSQASVSFQLEISQTAISQYSLRRHYGKVAVSVDAHGPDAS